MAIYELQCQACGDIQEILQNIKYTDEELFGMQCNKCAKIGVIVYIMSSGGFIINW